MNNDLSVKGFANVFAIGDRCSCFSEDGSEVPLRARPRGTDPKDFVYRDCSSLLSLSTLSTIGKV